MTPDSSAARILFLSLVLMCHKKCSPKMNTEEWQDKKCKQALGDVLFPPYFDRIKIHAPQ